MNHIVYFDSKNIKLNGIRATLIEHGYSVFDFKCFTELINPLALIIVEKDSQASKTKKKWQARHSNNPILMIDPSSLNSNTFFHIEPTSWQGTWNYHKSLPISVNIDFLCHEHWIHTCYKSELPSSYNKEFIVVQKACSFIDTHIDHTLTLKQVADHVGTNRTYLSRMFKNVMGITVFHWVKKLRMLKAASLLYETEHSVTNIALDVGIGQVSNFSKMFKNYLGIAPNEFRRSL